MASQPDSLYREILDSIGDPLYAVDAEWRITYVNPPIEAVWQRRSDELLGKELWEVFTNYQHSPGAQGIVRAMYERVPVHTETFSPYLQAWVEISAHPLAGGGLTVAFRDITARKQAEEGLRQAQAELEQRVNERTAELLQRNRDLDEFAYAASHDLRAPLRGIRNLADWIEQDAGSLLPPPSAAHLSRLRGRIERMDQLLTALLAYSRAGRQRHALEQIDLETLVRETVEMLAPPAGFTVQIGELPPALHGERVPLETIMRNLIGNAIKHHHQPQQGCVTVTGAVTAAAPAASADSADSASGATQGEWIEVVVSDNGPGIDPIYHERIFQIFQTLAPRDQVEGSGVGLSLVKKLVESRGGSIRVESGVGEGACFRFTWPLHPGAPAAHAGQQAEA